MLVGGVSLYIIQASLISHTISNQCIQYSTVQYSTVTEAQWRYQVRWGMSHSLIALIHCCTVQYITVQSSMRGHTVMEFNSSILVSLIDSCMTGGDTSISWQYDCAYWTVLWYTVLYSNVLELSVSETFLSGITLHLMLVDTGHTLTVLYCPVLYCTV